MITLTITPEQKLTEQQIEKAVAGLGLAVTMKASLKSLDTNMHWHYKKGKEKGVLEITWMKNSNELILSVHENRQGGWETGLFPLLESAFKRKVK